jgi:hypothetical protein
MTLGCGAQGNNITSDNISPLHLINLKRVAYGVRDVPTAPVMSTRERIATAKAVTTPGEKTDARSVVENVVDQWLVRKSRPAIHDHVPVSEVKPMVRQTSNSPQQPPLSSYRELQPPATKPTAASAPSKPVPFVCEDDVRTAIKGHERILIGKKTIITPSARELGEGNQVFVFSE